MNDYVCIKKAIMTKKLLLLTALFSTIIINAQSIATYSITFQGTWNEMDHGPLPSTDHWSDLVGATHNSDVVFWRMGELATPGIELVAELGQNGTFQSEVNAAIGNGDADQWLQAGFSPFAANGVATLSSIEVSEDFPLLTLATMIAPSPDWFSGVDSYSLLDGSGDWKDGITINVFPYDAGTEEGNGYSINNNASNPHVPIFARTGMIPFGTPTPVGTITFSLDEVLSTNDILLEESVRLSPNPSNGYFRVLTSNSTSIKTVTIYDVLGNQVKVVSQPDRNQEIKISDLSDGLYLVKIQGEQQQITKRLVVN